MYFAYTCDNDLLKWGLFTYKKGLLRMLIFEIMINCCNNLHPIGSYKFLDD